MATSRLCVKNLPKYCDDARLRTLFSEKGEVTDVKVRRTRDGRSRQFAYVGFKRVEDAEAAQRFFDRSFIDTSRLRVEFAYAAKGESTPAHRPWSKYSKGSSAHERQEKAKAAAAAASAAEEPAAANGHGKHAEGMKGAGRGKSHAEAGRKVQGGREDEPEELREFLQVMQPRSKGKLWTNDDAAQSAAARRSAAGASVAKVREALERGGDSSASDEDDELYQDLPGGGGPAAADDSEEEEEEEEEGAGKDPMVVDASVSDMEYLRSRMTADLDAFDDDDEFQQQVAAVYEEEEEEEEGDAIVDASKEVEEEAGEEEEEEGDDGDEERWRSKAEAEASDQPHETSGEGEGGAEGGAEVGGSGRLFVRNLPFTTTEAEVHDLFEQHGDVTDVHLVLDKLSKKGRGIGYVRFTEPQQAQQALEALDSTIFQGRLLHVLPAQDIPSAAAAAGAGVQAGEGGSFKQQREAERKRSAGNREAWNTMFMRQDTVAEAVAAHFGVAKRELLDPTSSDQAVRMALGETQVISKTKDCLLAAGVDVATLEAAAAASGKAAKTAGVARSATTLLVKNLPWGVTETELREMFSKCGALGRVVLPSTGTLALVEFLEPPDARQAFRSVAYKRMHHVPLYLEWAPKAVFSSAAPRPSERAAADAAAAMPEHASGSSGGVSAARGSSALLAGLVDSELEDEDAASLSIYVKNLNFATGDASLRKHFDAAASRHGGSLHSAKVAVKPGLKGKKALSMGYGFVECSSSSVAKALVKQLQGSLLDGHKLVLQLASAPRRADAGRAADAAAGGKMKASAKVLVRNLAFEATRKDLLGLFSPFGHVKSCRLPKKFDGSHRGFAFLEFGTKLEAKDAMQAAGSVHLYGRRLVLEYAKDEEGLDELRAKTAAKYRGKDGLAPPAKKART